MFITQIFNWLYTIMQLPVPIVLSPEHIFSITIWELFIGVLILGIFMILIERFFNGMSWNDFRVKEHVPETTDNIEKSHASNDLNGYDNIGRKRFPGNSARSKTSMGQRIVKNKSNYKDSRNIGVRLSESKVKERNRTYKSLEDYKMKKAMERNDE